MNYLSLFWLVNGVTALLRLFVIGRIGLSGDEAHYWAYTRYLDWSYFDHPPAIGYIIKFFTLVFGSTEFAVRFPTVIVFLAVSYAIFLLAREFYGDRVAFWSTVLLNVTPVFSFLGAVLTVPDAPLSLFWILFLYIFWKTMKSGAAANWYLLGALLGFGLLSKYNAILLVPSALLFLLFSKKHRHWLARKEPYLALALAFVVFLPVVIWNIENNFASFGFQMKHGFGHAAPQFSATLLGRCLGAQAGYISPLLFFLYWAVLFLLGRRFLVDKDEKSLFLFSFSFPTLFLFNSIASFNEILPHWPAMGYLILVIPVTALTLERWDRRGFRYLSIAGWGLGACLTVLVPLQAMYKILPPELFLPGEEASRIEDGITRAEKVDITNELYGWPEVGERIADLIERAPEPKPFILTHRHYVASQLSFYVPGHPRIYCFSERIDAYDFWQRDLDDLDGRNCIFVTNDYFYVAPEEILPMAAWGKSEPMEIYRSGRKVRMFWLTGGERFNVKDLRPEYTASLAGPYRSLKEGLRELDHRLFWLINRQLHSGPLDYLMWKITKIDTTLGVNTGLVLLMLLVGAVLRVTRPERFWREFLLAVAILCVGGLLVHFMKDAVDRLRPPAVFGDQVRLFHEHFHRGSFPSGHTQIAFAVAAYLATVVRKYRWLFFILAFFMGLSRVYIGVHFPSDVLAGGVIGAAVALAMVKLVKIR